MIKLYTFPQTRGMRGVWMLEEAGVEYKIVPVDIREQNVQRDSDFERASPLGKVPAIVDGDVAMAESSAICLYVADKYCPGALSPTIDDPNRGEFLFWLMFTPAVIEPCMAEAFGTSKANRIQHGWGDYPTMIAALTERLESRTWAMGDSFTAADVMLGSSVRFMKAFGIMPESEILDGYLARCAERPAFQRAEAASQPPSE
ncbi:MAG: glutathione S-transferase family protein [Pseudomonadota bacterium]